MKIMQLKDFKFKCKPVEPTDSTSKVFTHTMTVYDLYGEYLTSLNYISGTSSADYLGKNHTKLKLIRYIEENENWIYEKIIARRRKSLGIDE